MWCFYGLDNAFAYACFFEGSMGQYHTWYLVPCNELSVMLSTDIEGFVVGFCSARQLIALPNLANHA
jgi:hypothetical protein